MGPDVNQLDQIKEDAIRATTRHFRDEVEDNDFSPKVDIDKVKDQLLGELYPKDADTKEEVSENKKPEARKKAK